MILKDFTVGRLEVKCYLIACPLTKEAIIFDPAGSEEYLVNEIKRLGLTLKYIVNTHGHPDHTSGNQRMKELTGAITIMHKEDDELFRSPEISSYFETWGFKAHPPVDMHIKDGDVINVGSIQIRIIHTPGHSPGSTCFLFNGYLVTGDTLFVGGIGRYDLPGGNYDVLMRSIKDKILTLPGETKILPGHDYGHKPTSTIKDEKKNNPFISRFL